MKSLEQDFAGVIWILFDISTWLL